MQSCDAAQPRRSLFLATEAHAALHPVGTCRAGTDAISVVYEQLRVNQIGGLRVADGTIMPQLISGNPTAVCIMIGERAAKMLKAP